MWREGLGRKPSAATHQVCGALGLSLTCFGAGHPVLPEEPVSRYVGFRSLAVIASFKADPLTSRGEVIQLYLHVGEKWPRRVLLRFSAQDKLYLPYSSVQSFSILRLFATP